MKKIKSIIFSYAAILLVLTFIPAFSYAAEQAPSYQSLDELAGKRFAYVNGSVYNKSIQNKLEGTSEDEVPLVADDLSRQILQNLLVRQYVDNSGLIHLIIG